MDSDITEAPANEGSAEAPANQDNVKPPVNQGNAVALANQDNARTPANHGKSKINHLRAILSVRKQLKFTADSIVTIVGMLTTIFINVIAIPDNLYLFLIASSLEFKFLLYIVLAVLLGIYLLSPAITVSWVVVRVSTSNLVL
ncbi:17877_t:CDS:2 [Dentiscutata erythropus]|uniref:17877_t:CDS:1 n=1 Tax=Dentiscutata erythropus TaxID=1348616 RepID=A0A9N8VEL8_9GLOM|nr:17877_t:CDS:2 [Dentiscutata erythropus]